MPLAGAGMLSLVLVAGACNSHSGGNVTVGEGTAYKNGTAGTQRVYLPDGSSVTLRPGASIEVSKGYGKGDRRVDLDGEALFDVKDKTTDSFHVGTRNLDMAIQGSRFRIDAWRKNAGEEVDLLEGVLRVKKTYHSDTDNEPETLVSGEMVMINRDIDLMEKEKLNPEELKKIKESW
jgi:ferric-dicitrate binding protein FerR (iron transport regulator)